MSRRRELARRLSALHDIAGIMSAMRGLALMETHLLGGVLPAQQAMVRSIEQSAAQFLAWHPALAAPAAGPGELCLVLGSEQGFCGDYNEALLDAMARAAAAATKQPLHWVLIGHRLASRCGGDAQVVLTLPGATVADEVPAVLLRLTRELGALVGQGALAGRAISVLSHSDAEGAIRRRSLLPLQNLPPAAAQAFAPELNLAPADFLAGLTEHYLYAVLNEVLYSALMAENRLRQVHMQQALRKLDDDRNRLALAYNAQRQEDITEEIEIILLSAGAEEPQVEGRA